LKSKSKPKLTIGKEQALALLSQSSKEEFIFGSGHDIFNLNDYLRWGKVAGVKKHHIEPLNRKHYSGDDYKSTIFVNGEPVEYLEGIDNKDLLMWFSGIVGADTAQFGWISGRGTWARNVASEIYERLAEIAEIPVEQAMEMKRKANDIKAEDNS